MLSGCSAAALAADYSVSAGLEAKTSHNDNLRMVEDDKTAVMHYDLVPTIDLSANTEVSKFAFTSRFDFNRYSKSEFDSDDQTFGLSYTREFENMTLGLDATAVLDSTITSEQTGSGRIGDSADPTELYMLRPSWSYVINETNMLQLGASYAQQDYHTANYIGYQSYGGTLDWIHILNERWKVILSGSYSKDRYDDRTLTTRSPFPPGTFGEQTYTNQSESKGAQLGVNYMVSEQSELQLRLGSSKDEQESEIKDPQNICSNSLYQQLVSFGLNPGGSCAPTPTEKNTVSTAELNWNWSNELHDLNLDVSKRTQPTSNGYTVDSLQLRSAWNYKFTELDQVFADVTLIRNRAIDERTPLIGGLADRDYQTATIRYQRRIGEEWFASASYQYNHQEYTEIDYKASANVISLGIRYQPLAWHWSR